MQNRQIERFGFERLVEKPRYNRTVHGLALITAAATFPLIFMGGLVTSHQAGMSVPDWPNSWGYNMFTFPPSKWVGGILFEHTHRLAGAFVGLLTILLMIAAWTTDRRRWVRWTAVAIFLARLRREPSADCALCLAFAIWPSSTDARRSFFSASLPPIA